MIIRTCAVGDLFGKVRFMVKRALRHLATMWIGGFVVAMCGCQGTEPMGSATADAGADRTVALGETVQLDGSLSATSSGGDLSYSWSQTAGAAVALGATDAVIAAFTADAAGSFTFRLTVTTSDGLTATDDVTITVVAPPAGRISGRITISSAQGDAILEAEPNDTVDQAHFLGALRAGDTITVLGRTTALNDSDLFDGFALVAPERIRITATLEFDGSGGNDFDMFVYDPVGMQFVEAFTSETAPEIGSFHAKGAFDLVLQAFTGSGDYALTLAAEAASEVNEREPNGDFGNAQYLGELTLGDTVTVFGNANAVIDPLDGVVIAFPAAVNLQANLAFPPGGDFDVRVYDATTSLLSPVQMTAFESETANPETGVVTVGAMRLLHIDVEAFNGSGDYTLTLTAGAPTQARAAQGIAPLTAERNRGRTRFPTAFYGRPKLEFAPGQALIRINPEHDAKTVLALRSCRVIDSIGGQTHCVEFDVPVGMDVMDRMRCTTAMIRCLNAAGTFEYVKPNRYRRTSLEPNDEFFNLQWHYAMIQLPGAWDVTTGDANVLVAVIDTGTTDHPDLAGRQIDGFDFISDLSISGDGDGIDADPTDVGDGAGVSASSFHGSHVSGTVAATTNNAIGVSGVTWFTRVMAVRALGLGGVGSDFDIANGIRYSARLSNNSGQLPAEPADIVNMSFGGPDFSQTVADAVAAARNEGVLLIAASGNENTSVPYYPAALDGVVSVGAVDLDRGRAPYSNFGTTLDFVAPGGNTAVDRNGDGFVDGVLSTIFDDRTAPAEPIFAFYQGTSMASPHVAGVAALMLAVNPTLTPDQLETILASTAEDLGAPGRDDVFGNGLVNAQAAVLAAQGGVAAEPLLTLSADTLHFNGVLDALTVQVSNLGGEPLTVGPITATTQSGGDWLSVFTVASTDPLKDISALVIAVDRTGLADGTYLGAIAVNSNGGSRDVQIIMQVRVSPTVNESDIFILAVDPATLETVTQVVQTAATTLDYALDELPPGRYIVVAGTDDDDDGFICGPGEICGAYPVENQPVDISLDAGEDRSNIDFTIFFGLLEPTTAASPAGMRFQRLR
jgi:subtilisin family serine protease